MSALRFVGYVSFRSSLPNAGGPPGEVAIHSLNPQRETQICALTGWPRLEPGSLNLDVQDDVVPKLKALAPTWEEDGNTVIYPPSLEHIPKGRGAYLYYLGESQSGGKHQQVLVRTSRNPLPRRVELFAPIKLKSYFGLNAKDRVTVDVHAI